MDTLRLLLKKMRTGRDRVAEMMQVGSSDGVQEQQHVLLKLQHRRAGKLLKLQHRRAGTRMVARFFG